MKNKVLICSALISSLSCISDTKAKAETALTNIDSVYRVKTIKDWGKIFLILKEIDEYQKRYFEIIKRHDYMIFRDVIGEYEKDFADLSSLNQEISEKIGKNNPLLRELQNIPNRLDDEKNTTSSDLAVAAGDYAEKVRAFLDNIYEKLRMKLTSEDFELLRKSEENWNQDFKSYLKRAFLDNEQLGSIAGLQIGTCISNIRYFRATLLILLSKYATTELYK